MQRQISDGANYDDRSNLRPVNATAEIRSVGPQNIKLQHATKNGNWIRLQQTTDFSWSKLWREKQPETSECRRDNKWGVVHSLTKNSQCGTKNGKWIRLQQTSLSLRTNKWKCIIVVPAQIRVTDSSFQFGCFNKWINTTKT